MVDDQDDPDAPIDTSTPEGVARQTERIEEQNFAEKDVLRSWLSTANGRKLFFDIVYNLCLLRSPLTNGLADTNFSLLKEGARQVGLDLETRALQAARTQYMVMLDENLPKPLKAQRRKK